MNAFQRSISQILKGAVKAFQTFPAVIGFALAFSVVTMVRIQLDWPQQEAYNFLFNCLHWSFAFGAIFSLAAITAAQSRYNTARSFMMANVLGVVAVIIAFLLLYFLGGTDPKLALTGARYARISGLASARMSVAIFVSFVAFIYLAGHPKDQSDFARSFFMTHKAFFIAVIYGAVIMGGTSGVAGAFQALLYREMSSKVYQYIGTLVGFLTFTMFVGFFPDFRKGILDERRETAQKQPRFIEILFGSIMIPIVLALTVVLLIWSARATFTGVGASFLQLSGIATSYAVGGIWLHIMVTRYDTKMAAFYRMVYPITALIILAFEAWALIVQLNRWGMKMTEYTFILIWIIAVVSVILLLVRRAKAHPAIAALACGLAIFSVLPIVGYHSLPVKSQLSRLETLLVSQGLLVNEALVPATTEPELSIRESITDSVSYLAYAENAKLPGWFDPRLGESSTFKARLGFEQVWTRSDDPFVSGPDSYTGLYLRLQPGAYDISGYQWGINLQSYEGKEPSSTAVIQGEKGTYSLSWAANAPSNIPVLTVELDGRVILEEDMNAYIDRITEKFPPGRTTLPIATFEDMSLKLESPEVEVLLVFGNVDINMDPRSDQIYYWFNLNTLYMSEK
jgi:hypothetical protein